MKSLNEVTQDLQFPLSDPKSDWIKSSDNIIIPKNTLSSIKQQGGHYISLKSHNYYIILYTL